MTHTDVITRSLRSIMWVTGLAADLFVSVCSIALYYRHDESLFSEESRFKRLRTANRDRVAFSSLLYNLVEVLQ